MTLQVLSLISHTLPMAWCSATLASLPLFLGAPAHSLSSGLSFLPLLFLPTAETPSHTSSGLCSDRPYPLHCPVLLSPQHVSSPETVGLIYSSVFLSLPHSSVKALRPGSSVSFIALNPNSRGTAWQGGHWLTYWLKECPLEHDPPHTHAPPSMVLKPLISQVAEAQSPWQGSWAGWLELPCLGVGAYKGLCLLTSHLGHSQRCRTS